MSDAWVEARRVARRLSRTGLEDAFGDRNNYLGQFYARTIEYLETANIDRRAKAIGPDLSFLSYQIGASENESWTEMLWSYESDITIWEDILRPIPQDGSAVEPLKILTHLCTPSRPVHPTLAGDGREYTFINTTELFCLEEFLFKQPDSQGLGPFVYSMVTQQDILNGEVDACFDLVRIWSWLVVRPTRSILKKYMDSVKIGGLLVINDASNLNQIYDNSLNAHYSPYYDMSKHVANDERFVTYHLPHNVGTIVARRVR